MNLTVNVPVKFDPPLTLGPGPTEIGIQGPPKTGEAAEREMVEVLRQLDTTLRELMNRLPSGSLT